MRFYSLVLEAGRLAAQDSPIDEWIDEALLDEAWIQESLDRPASNLTLSRGGGHFFVNRSKFTVSAYGAPNMSITFQTGRSGYSLANWADPKKGRKVLASVAHIVKKTVETAGPENIRSISFTGAGESGRGAAGARVSAAKENLRQGFVMAQGRKVELDPAEKTLYREILDGKLDDRTLDTDAGKAAKRLVSKGVIKGRVSGDKVTNIDWKAKASVDSRPRLYKLLSKLIAKSLGWGDRAAQIRGSHGSYSFNITNTNYEKQQREAWGGLSNEWINRVGRALPTREQEIIKKVMRGDRSVTDAELHGVVNLVARYRTEADAVIAQLAAKRGTTPEELRTAAGLDRPAEPHAPTAGAARAGARAAARRSAAPPPTPSGFERALAGLSRADRNAVEAVMQRGNRVTGTQIRRAVKAINQSYVPGSRDHTAALTYLAYARGESLATYQRMATALAAREPAAASVETQAQRREREAREAAETARVARERAEREAREREEREARERERAAERERQMQLAREREVAMRAQRAREREERAERAAANELRNSAATIVRMLRPTGRANCKQALKDLARSNNMSLAQLTARTGVQC